MKTSVLLQLINYVVLITDFKAITVLAQSDELNSKQKVNFK